MALCLLIIKSSPPRRGGAEKNSSLPIYGPSKDILYINMRCCPLERAFGFRHVPNHGDERTRTRTNTNPNGTEAYAAGRSGNAECACVAQTKQVRNDSGGEGHWPQAARLHVVVCIFEEMLFFPLPLRGRGRSSCPVKASYGSGAEQ